MSYPEESRRFYRRFERKRGLFTLYAGRPYPPQTQGKIERDHRTMKNVVKLENDDFPGELEIALKDFVAYNNNERYHESLKNVTPADVYFGRQHVILTKRGRIKQSTTKERKRLYRASKAA